MHPAITCGQCEKPILPGRKIYAIRRGHAVYPFCEPCKNRIPANHRLNISPARARQAIAVHLAMRTPEAPGFAITDVQFSIFHKTLAAYLPNVASKIQEA